MRAVSAVMVVFLLNGCVPPVVTVASYVADGASYASTGKTMSEHGMTMATGHDCSLIRNFTAKGPICNSEIAQREDPAPVEVGGHPTLRAEKYVILGTFTSEANAQRMAERFADLAVTVMPVDVAGKHYLRVIAGPLTESEATALKARVAPAGV